MRLIIQPDYQSVSQWDAHYVAAKKLKAANPTPENHLYWAALPDLLLGMYKALIDL